MIKIGLRGNWRVVGVLAVIIVVTVTVIFLACELPGDRLQITPVHGETNQSQHIR